MKELMLLLIVFELAILNIVLVHNLPRLIEAVAQ